MMKKYCEEKEKHDRCDKYLNEIKDHGTRGPRDQRTRGPKDQGTKGTEKKKGAKKKKKGSEKIRPPLQNATRTVDNRSHDRCRKQRLAERACAFPRAELGLEVGLRPRVHG